MSEARGRYRRVLSYALPHWPALALTVGLSLLAAASTALQPWPLKMLVDYALQGAPLPAAVRTFAAANGLVLDAPTLVVAAAAASIIIFAAGALLDAVLTMTWARAGQRMVYALASDVFLQLQRLSLLFHARRTVGDSLSRVTSDAWCVHAAVDSLLIGPAKQAVVIVTVGVLAFLLDRNLALLLIAATPALAASSIYFGRRLKSVETVRRETMVRLSAFVHQVLGAIPVVQAFGTRAHNQRLFAAAAGHNIAAQRESARIHNEFAALNGLATTTGIALVIYVGGRQVLEGAMTLGSLLVFIAYVRSLDSACRDLLKRYASLRVAEAGMDRVLEIFDTTERVRDAPGALPLPERGSGRCGRLLFDRVSFGYEAGQPVLEDLSLDVHAGETLALVGTSGAGKTTLASLVPRFFEPWQGRVLVDGVDVAKVTVASLRGEIALVLQDSFILPMTVAENIAYGRPGASREDIVKAATAANADEFVRRLEDGYDTILGEQGADLSGGQRQRIAIARALLKDPRIVILDEPTAALDAESDRTVMAALANLLRGRTTLIIAHRLSTIRFADRIAVIDGGRIAELGTPEALLAANGLYARLHALTETGEPPEPAA